MSEIVNKMIADLKRVVSKEQERYAAIAEDTAYPESARTDAAAQAAALESIEESVEELQSLKEDLDANPMCCEPEEGEHDRPENHSEPRDRQTRQEAMTQEARSLALKYPGTIFMGFDPSKPEEVEMAQQQINAIMAARRSAQ